MQVGKLPHELLEKFLSQVHLKDSRVLIGPQSGEDAAVLDMGDSLLVATSDPVTFASDLVGWYAVQVNANDVAAMGATPRWFLATILLPPATSPQAASGIFDQVVEACNSLGISLIGGHTEVSQAVNHPIVSGCMLGEVVKGKLVTCSGALPGDSIVVTKGIAIEGTALLARDFSQRLLQLGAELENVTQARDFLFTPGISVIKDASIACAAGRVHSMHDVTEGGLATGLRELAGVAGVGLVIEEGSVPILPQCLAICQAAGLDPLGLLASGCLIITLPPEDVPALLSALEGEGIDAYEIGQITDADEGIKMIGASDPEPVDLPAFERDELARFLES